MIEFLAFVWLTSKESYREREDDSSLWLTFLLVPIVVTVLFTYML